MLINNYFGFIFYSIAIYEYCMLKFPNETQEIILYIIDKLMFFISKTQIIISKQNKNINEIIDKYKKYQIFITFITFFKFLSNTQNCILQTEKYIVSLDFVKDNTPIYTFSENFYKFNSQKIPSEFDFCVITHQKNKRVEKKWNGINNILQKFVEVSYKPVLIEFSIDVEDYETIIESFKIELKTNEYNFLIEGNQFDYKFFIYFITMYYKKHVCNLSDKLLENYKLKIIDADINIREYTKNEIIIVGKNNLSLLT